MEKQTGERGTGFAASPAGRSRGAATDTSPIGGSTRQPPAETAGQTTLAGGQPGTAGTNPSGGIVDKVKERATAQLSSQKGRATEGLDTIAQAVRQTTQQLRADDHGAVADYIDKAADHIERFSTRLRDKDVNELLRDAQQLARRQPALFIGSSFALGLLAARFIKSSQRNSDYGYPDRDEAGLDRFNTGAY